jgi:hypothetical protein
MELNPLGSVESGNPNLANARFGGQTHLRAVPLTPCSFPLYARYRSQPRKQTAHIRVDNVGSQGRLCHIIDDADESGSMARTIPGTIHIRQQESEQADECGNKM